MAYFYSKLFNKAFKLLRKYVKIFTTSCEEIQKENIDNFGNALNTLFKIMLRNNNLEKGINYLELAKKYLHYFKTLNRPISFIIHNNLAYAYLKTCQFQKVVTLLESFINSEANFIHINIMPDIYISLNIACYNIGDYDKSIYYIKKAILLFEYMEKYSDTAECYLNYINAIRYSGNFEEAFKILEENKKKFRGNPEIYYKFVNQEMILYFNTGQYDKIVEISEEIDISLFNHRGKREYEFMLGHIKYLQEEPFEAYNLLKKCENYFLTHKYYGDLCMLYEDLYCITDNPIYKKKKDECKNKIGRKNITTTSL
ncbi:tetratricopeptide repeat protein [Thermoanaerobacter ethanolicus]|uniref:tetratricopeptide repeat protein n=1 Tax=Thermoanaerobacter ethanolicus TaxID=1757 RepID=UPI00296F320E